MIRFDFILYSFSVFENYLEGSLMLNPDENSGSKGVSGI
jgi:hypothetical protein